ncbi:hypothetical protein BH23VER1_BH23VER1_13370 [soil metagenome]
MMKPSSTALTALAAILLSLSPADVSAQQGAASLRQLHAEGRAAFYRGDYETARVKLAQVLEAKPGHAETRALMARLNVLAEEQSGNPAMERKMASIIIDSIDLKDVTATEAVEYLVLKTKSRSDDEFRPNIVLKEVPGEDAAPKFTLQLNNVPASYALSAIGNLAGLKFNYDKYAIIGTPRNPAAEPAATPDSADTDAGEPQQ